MPDDKLEVLPYGRRPRRSRKGLVAYLIMTAILCSGIGFWYCRHQWPHWERRYWVYRCCHYVGRKNQAALHPNEYWAKLSRDGVSSDDHNVFCHEVTARTGLRRLVIVDVRQSSFRQSRHVPLSIPPTNDGSLACLVWDPAVLQQSGDLNSASWSSLIGIWTIGNGWRCDFLNGELDPADGSHFSFGYQLDDKRGTIDGWLCDDGTVKLKIRDGPATPY